MQKLTKLWERFARERVISVLGFLDKFDNNGKIFSKYTRDSRIQTNRKTKGGRIVEFPDNRTITFFCIELHLFM